MPRGGFAALAAQHKVLCGARPLLQSPQFPRISDENPRTLPLKGSVHMQDQENRPTVPLGLGYALAANAGALKAFAAMSDQRRNEVIEQTRSITSKAEMRQFVERLNTEQT